MQSSIYKFILHYSRKQQLVVLLITASSLPFYYALLDVPKKIVNQALGGDEAPFPKTFDLFGVDIAEFGQFDLLYVLCAMFIGLVFINGGFKYFINVYKGLLGERMLRRLRYQLYGRILRFPQPHFRKVSQGELIPMITAEVEPLGGFIGDAFALPMHQGGILMTLLLFIFMQDWVLGLSAIAFYPLQMYVIPKLQRRVNQLGKQRVREVRRLSERIGETVSGAQEIHAHDTSNYEIAHFGNHLGRIFEIRYRIYRLKFFTKFLNNFINQLTPFLFYSIGGYLVIVGQLSLGALIAVLAAYKELASPWKELLRYYQTMEDARIKYEQVVVQFDPPGLKDVALLEDDAESDAPLTGEVVAGNLAYTDDDVKIVSAASFRFPADERVGIVGAGGSGKSELALLLARLLDPTRGRITIGDADIQKMPEAITGRRIAFVGANAHLHSASLGENLYYGLMHRPLRPDAPDQETAADRRKKLVESIASGNSTLDVWSDWTDYEAAGVHSPEDLVGAGLRALHIADMGEDIYQLGLRGAVDPVERPEVADRILRARAALRERLADPELAALVEPFDNARYNDNATLAENLLFGTPVGDTLDTERLAENPYMLSVLEGCGLIDDLLGVGYEVADTMVELFSDLPPEHDFFEQFSFIGADDLPAYRDLLGRADRDNLAGLKDEERRDLLSLPFRLIPARHALGLLDDDMKARLLKARAAFARGLPDDLKDAVEFFDPERYNAAAALQDNIMFGKLAYGQAEASERIGSLISEIIDELGLRDTVCTVGLDFQVGVGGARLSGAQRQKLAVARCVLKRPDILIVSEALAALDGKSQNVIARNLLDEFKGRGLIWVLQRPSLAAQFDRVLVMRGGRVIEEGRYDELDRPDSHFKELIAAE